jgi:WD40 repeat protein
MQSTDARDTPTNLFRLEEVIRLSQSCAGSMKEPRERIKAFQLLIIALYHHTSYCSSKKLEIHRWSEGKRISQVVLSRDVFQMPEVSQGLAREGTAIGRFGQRKRRHLIREVIHLSDFVFSLKPMFCNDTHPPLPSCLYSALLNMSLDSSPILSQINVSHVLALIGAPPLEDVHMRGTAHRGCVTSVDIIPGTSMCLSSGDDGQLMIWKCGVPICATVAHSAHITAQAIFFGYQQDVSAFKVLTCSADRTLKLWEAHSDGQPFRCLGSLVGHKAGVTSVFFIQGGHKCVSASSDGDLKIWNLDDALAWGLGGEVSYACVETLVGAHDGMGITCLSCFENNSSFISGGEDGSLRVWNMRSPESLHGGGESVIGPELETMQKLEMNGHDGRVNCVSLFHGPSADLSDVFLVQAISGGQDNTLRVWSLEGSNAGCCLSVLDGCVGAVWACVVLAGGTRAVSASDDTVMRVWDLEKRSVLHALPGHPHREYCLDIFSSGSRLGICCGGNDPSGQIKFWHIACDGGKFEFSLGPSTIPPLLKSLSPKPRRKKQSATRQSENTEPVCFSPLAAKAASDESAFQVTALPNGVF